jgi:hypothetical protein
MPVDKTNDPGSLTDYRPISILPVLSKAMKIIIQNQNYAYRKQWNDESTSISNHSTTTALLKITNDLLLAIRRQFTAHNSPRTIHRAQFIAHNSPRHNSPRTIHHAQCPVHTSPCTLHRAQFTVHNSPFTIHRAQFTAHNSPRTIHRAQFTAYYSPRKIKKFARWILDSARLLLDFRYMSARFR